MKHVIQIRLILLLIIGFVVTITASAQDSDNDAIVAAVMETGESEIIQSYASPDAAYTAEVTVYPCTLVDEQEMSYEILELIDNSTNERQFVAEQIINCGGLGGYGLWVTRWSENGTHFFYTDAREGTPDGIAIGWVAPLYRVRTDDLTVERLGQALFSPDGIWIVTWNGEGIRLMEPESVESIDFSLIPESLQIVQVIWLPDSSGILYIQADAPFMSLSSTVTHIDIATLQQSVLLES